MHELSHGLSHRLIGNGSGLLWDVPRSMGEGWSDFYAMALLNIGNSDAPDAQYPFAAWITYKLSALTDNYVYGFRRFPYATDNNINPLTFEDVDAVTADESGGIAPSPLNIGAAGALEVHNAGSVWAQTLWEVRARIIADAAGANGDVGIGNETMLQLVTDALKMTPVNPSFVDGRDALLAADCATNACANEQAIWGGFADRGLGYRAVAPLAVMGRFALAHMGVGSSVVSPSLDALDAASAVTVDDSVLGNGDGRIDPGESVGLVVALSNPWHRDALAATLVSATLSSPSPYLIVDVPQANYPDIAPQATVANLLDRFAITLASDAACGSTIPLDLTTVSSLGTHTVHFNLRVGSPGGVGAAITFTDIPNLAIPVGAVDGVSADMNIADDLEIADLDFRVDSLLHPVTGHLSVMLRAPDGYGADLIWRRGVFLVPNQGGGANLVNVEIDDDLPTNAAFDLSQSLSSQAPFSGSWLPAFNGPFWDSYRPTPPSPPAPIQRDPVGQLSRLAGTSTQGRWTINVANGSNTLTGSLQSWSLIVQPRLFSCSVFAPGSALFSDGFESSPMASHRFR